MSSGESEYEVETILDHSEKNMFHIAWKGYPLDQNTWEPLENVYQCNAFKSYLGTLEKSEKNKIQKAIKRIGAKKRGRPRKATSKAPVTRSSAPSKKNSGPVPNMVAIKSPRSSYTPTVKINFDRLNAYSGSEESESGSEDPDEFHGATFPLKKTVITQTNLESERSPSPMFWDNNKSPEHDDVWIQLEEERAHIQREKMLIDKERDLIEKKRKYFMQERTELDRIKREREKLIEERERVQTERNLLKKEIEIIRQEREAREQFENERKERVRIERERIAKEREELKQERITWEKERLQRIEQEKKDWERIITRHHRDEPNLGTARRSAPLKRQPVQRTTQEPESMEIESEGNSRAQPVQTDNTISNETTLEAGEREVDTNISVERTEAVTDSQDNDRESNKLLVGLLSQLPPSQGTTLIDILSLTTHRTNSNTLKDDVCHILWNGAGKKTINPLELHEESPRKLRKLV